MNKLKLIGIISIGSFLSQCAVNNVAFNMPSDLSENDKKEFVARFNHGIKLYKINCEKCHNNSPNEKEHGPNFTQAQIRSYEIALKMNTQKHAFVQKMNADDIDDIIIYLKYRKIEK